MHPKMMCNIGGQVSRLSWRGPLVALHQIVAGLNIVLVSHVTVSPAGEVTFAQNVD
jgi:hypothetical protein